MLVFVLVLAREELILAVREPVDVYERSRVSWGYAKIGEVRFGL